MLQDASFSFDCGDALNASGLRHCPEAFTHHCGQLLRLLWPVGVLFDQDSEPGTAFSDCVYGLSEVLSDSLRTPYAPWTAGIILKQKLCVVCFRMPYCGLALVQSLSLCEGYGKLWYESWRASD